MAGRFGALSVKLTNFGGIGILNTLIHNGIVIGLVQMLAVWPPIGHFFGFIAASLFSYLANARFTFRMKLSIPGYLRFVSVSLTTLGTALLLSTIVQVAGWNYMIGIGLIIVINPLLSFTLHHHVTFRKQ